MSTAGLASSRKGRRSIAILHTASAAQMPAVPCGARYRRQALRLSRGAKTGARGTARRHAAAQSAGESCPKYSLAYCRRHFGKPPSRGALQIGVRDRPLRCGGFPAPISLRARFESPTCRSSVKEEACPRVRLNRNLRRAALPEHLSHRAARWQTGHLHGSADRRIPDFIKVSIPNPRHSAIGPAKNAAASRTRFSSVKFRRTFQILSKKTPLQRKFSTYIFVKFHKYIRKRKIFLDNF